MSIVDTIKGKEGMKYFDIEKEPDPNYCFEKAKLLLLNYDKLDELQR